MIILVEHHDERKHRVLFFMTIFTSVDRQAITPVLFFFWEMIHAYSICLCTKKTDQFGQPMNFIDQSTEILVERSSLWKPSRQQYCKILCHSLHIEWIPVVIKWKIRSLITPKVINRKMLIREKRLALFPSYSVRSIQRLIICMFICSFLHDFFYIYQWFLRKYRRYSKLQKFLFFIR